MEFRIACLPGDGIGPEVLAEAVKVLEAVARQAEVRFHFQWDDLGGAAIDRYGTPLRPETVELCRASDAVLFGAVGGPRWDDPTLPMRPEQAILELRRHLGLFANLRPVKVYPLLAEASVLKPEVLQGVDIVVVRELTGGLYFGKPRRRERRPEGWYAVDTLEYTEEEVRRVLRVGFELARRRRRKLTSVDKANVLESSRLWRQLATELGKEYPDVALEHMLVDTAAMQLVLRPSRFDVVVTENMFGDILTDEAGVLAASMGMLPSASLAGVPVEGQRAFGLYEPIHGSAPDIAGKGLANPLAAVLSAALMLRYSLGLPAGADAMERAVERALADGYRTADIARDGATVSTREMGDAVAERVTL